MRIVFQHEFQGAPIIRATQLASKVKAEVDAGRDASGGDAVAVFYNSTSAQLSAQIRQDFANGPMAGGAISAQKTGSSE